MVFAICALLGWLTREAIQDESIDRYRSQGWPTVSMWEGYLERLGYQPVRPESAQARYLRFYPREEQTTPIVRESEDGCLLYAILPEADTVRHRLWSCGGKPPVPRQWRTLGTGWKAFQNLTKLAAPAPKPSKKLSNPIDPKEIRY